MMTAKEYVEGKVKSYTRLPETPKGARDRYIQGTANNQS